MCKSNTINLSTAFSPPFLFPFFFAPIVLAKKNEKLFYKYYFALGVCVDIEKKCNNKINQNNNKMKSDKIYVLTNSKKLNKSIHT